MHNVESRSTYRQKTNGNVISWCTDDFVRKSNKLKIDDKRMCVCVCVWYFM